uniref:Uncharacterized protein n=1 Tax=Avena sativa TaxID=4498 RepID=A0ACD5UTF7_AVESA
MGGGWGALIAVAAAILLCSCSVGVVRCDAASAVSQEHEIQRLRSKVALLEDEVSWSKDETSQLEDVVREKTAQIAALVAGLDALQARNAADDESVVKTSTSNALLEEQIERLGNDLEDQVRKGELLEARASEAERRLLELGHKLERVEKINMEQRRKIEELEHDLQQSEEKLTELEREAKLTAEELTMVRGMWLPYWFASRSVHCQELASAKWHHHGKPALHALKQKVSETLARAHGLMEPHLQAAQNKLLPVAKTHFDSLKKSARPYVSEVANKCARAYMVSRDAIQPCVANTQGLADHYWQVSKKFSEPYIAAIAAASEPRLSRARVVLEPYIRPVTSAWRNLVTATSMYHRQVQRGVGRFLEDNELLSLNPPSAYRLAWWMASALFVLPMLAINKIFSVTVRKKKKSGQTRRRDKRRVDK